MEIRYQLVTFFDRLPAMNELVYQGSNGWYPQVALKRRFLFNGISEDDGLAKIQDYVSQADSFDIKFGNRLKPDWMPVDVIEIIDSPELIAFHRNFISFMGDNIVSGHPDREDSNFYPHMTVTWNGKDVVDVNQFINQKRHINTAWVIKDEPDSQDCRVIKVSKLANP